MDPLLAHPGQWSRQSVQNCRRPETPTRDSKTALKIQATLTAEGGRSGHVRAVIHRHVPKNPRHRPIFFSFHRACGSVCVSRSRDFVVVYSVESVLPRPTGVPSALMLSNFKHPMVERSGHPSLPTVFWSGHGYRHRARPLSVDHSGGTHPLRQIGFHVDVAKWNWEWSGLTLD